MARFRLVCGINSTSDASGIKKKLLFNFYYTVYFYLTVILTVKINRLS